MHPEYFPNVFGVNGDEPLDVEIVRKKFLLMSNEIAKETGKMSMNITLIAEGFLKIAVENIRKIVDKTDFDLETYVLNWKEFKLKMKGI